jgi:hypothetical protein
MESEWEQDVRRVLGAKGNDVTVGWRKLNSEELHDL